MEMHPKIANLFQGREAPCAGIVTEHRPIGLCARGCERERERGQEESVSKRHGGRLSIYRPFVQPIDPPTRATS